MFDVVYADGTQRSNRKVPRALTGGIDSDKLAHGFLIEQDREIAEKSGRHRRRSRASPTRTQRRSRATRRGRKPVDALSQRHGSLRRAARLRPGRFTRNTIRMRDFHFALDFRHIAASH
jgi:hypothetical protein